MLFLHCFEPVEPGKRSITYLAFITYFLLLPLRVIRRGPNQSTRAFFGNLFESSALLSFPYILIEYPLESSLLLFSVPSFWCVYFLPCVSSTRTEQNVNTNYPSTPHHITSLSFPSQIQSPCDLSSRVVRTAHLGASLFIDFSYFYLLFYLLRYEYSVFTSDDHRTEPFSVYIRPERQICTHHSLPLPVSFYSVHSIPLGTIVKKVTNRHKLTKDFSFSSSLVSRDLDWFPLSR